ncbi:MAG: hypothetical protein JRD93_12610 [Deltaproteobacteria bacterium]|nr:hypothetical protein [Deltaproteobacteria bacterium]
MSIIEVNHVIKEYRLGHMKGLKQSVLNTPTGSAVNRNPSPLTQESRADLTPFFTLFHVPPFFMKNFKGKVDPQKGTLLLRNNDG